MREAITGRRSWVLRIGRTVIDESEILPEAHKLYNTFQRLIVDQILSSHDRNKSKSFFMKLTVKQAFKVIEIELSLIYEALYTKALLVYTPEEGLVGEDMQNVRGQLKSQTPYK
ncbi:hypothetical protein QJS10_CPB13g00874 [Acorus calamus]|uniref:DUF4220 domain-containing protein n=1 Tax=Acorus calamus TaxID=4465 RepID=A0AAV9DG31_ACOCL|nr:hypothetical protein QJS10_CPB13g00874 [Acorus calamus]